MQNRNWFQPKVNFILNWKQKRMPIIFLQAWTVLEQQHIAYFMFSVRSPVNVNKIDDKRFLWRQLRIERNLK